MPRSLSPLLVAALCLLAPAGARAQAPGPGARASAQALYDLAVADMRKKEYASACPRLEEVIRLEPEGLGARLTLAECYEQDGRLASAWAAYRSAEAAAVKASAKKRVDKARAAAAALEPRLARLTIVVPKEIALRHPTIERDGAPIGEVEWGIPLPLDRGKHRVAASAPGKVRWETAVEVTAEGASLSVTVPDLADEPQPAPAVVPPPPPKAVEAPPPPPPKPAPPPTTQRTAGLVVGGIGLAGLGAGLVFGIVTIALRDRSNAGHCVGNRCDEVGIRLRDEGLAFADRANAMVIAGAVVLGGGVLLYLTAPRAPAPASVSLGPRGAALQAAW